MGQKGTRCSVFLFCFYLREVWSVVMLTADVNLGYCLWTYLITLLQEAPTISTVSSAQAGLGTVTVSAGNTFSS